MGSGSQMDRVLGLAIDSVGRFKLGFVFGFFFVFPFCGLLLEFVMLMDIAYKVGHIAPAKGFKCRSFPRSVVSLLVLLSGRF